MSSKQTESRKASVQVPEGWSPFSHLDSGKPTPDGSETNLTKKFGNSPGADTILSKDSNGTANSPQTDLPEHSGQTLWTELPLQTESAPPTGSTPLTLPKRSSGKQRKESLEEYRRTFLTIPKLEDRKPVFISCDVRDRIDEIVRKLGGRGRSVSGFIENLARHHLEVYNDDVDIWKKL